MINMFHCYMFPVLAHYVAAYASYLNSVMMIIYILVCQIVYSQYRNSLEKNIMKRSSILMMKSV